MSKGFDKGFDKGFNIGFNSSRIEEIPPVGVTGIFVDNTVASSSTYDPDTRTIGSGDQPVYQTIQAAVNAMVSGDDVWIRGAVGGGTETYLENVSLKGNTHPSGTSGNYCSLQSYPGEWAKIDGQNNQEYAIGKIRNGRTPSEDLNFWKFERLEITGGTTGGIDGGAGLYISGGPFIVRYLYVHDNICTASGGNPAGIGGYCWRESLMEFCSFENNGHLTSTDRNYAHVNILGDYTDQEAHGQATTYDPDIVHNRNEVRYNLFGGGTSVGFKVKGSQILTGRDTGGNDYSDTYDDWGDKVHHNFFENQNSYGVILSQDFQQFYNNIIINPGSIGIAADAHQPHFQKYKQAVYNNYVNNPNGDGILHYGSDTVFTFTANPEHWLLNENNIIDEQGNDAAEGGSWCSGTAINLNVCSNDSDKPRYSGLDLSNAIVNKNYCYRPTITGNEMFQYDGPDPFEVWQTSAAFESSGPTALPRVMYQKASSEGSDNLMVGASGADQYVTRGAHVMETGVTIADGGVGGSHPWLTGVTLPSYVGATNPNDNDWVDGVLNDVSSVVWLKAQSPDSTPSWVEV